MGCNFYLVKPACEHCGRSDEPLHIGKSSSGWCFSLHVMPEMGINTLDDWMPLLATGTIKDDYGETCSIEELLGIIREREGTEAPRPGFSYEQNHAVPGPNGLVRARIDSRHCVGHGEGTWDYIIGYFC